MKKLTHLDERGDARMVDIGDKAVSRRTAVAAGSIQLNAETFAALTDGQTPKGDVLAAARFAAISVAKRTAEWIPLCHVLPLESVRAEFELDAAATAVHCRVTVSATAKTGVEMEALIGVQAALTTIYDMLKAMDKGMLISDIRLLEKHGGSSGDFVRE